MTRLYLRQQSSAFPRNLLGDKYSLYMTFEVIDSIICNGSKTFSRLICSYIFFIYHFVTSEQRFLGNAYLPIHIIESTISYLVNVYDLKISQ